MTQLSMTGSPQETQHCLGLHAQPGRPGGGGSNQYQPVLLHCSNLEMSQLALACKTSKQGFYLGQ